MTWLTWLPRLVAFGAWYAWELVTSNVAVIRDNLTPGQSSTPGIAELPLRCRTDFEVMALGALITLTPGTLTLGATERESTRVIFVHGMYADGPDHLRDQLHDMERRLLRAVRRNGDSS